MNDSKHANAHIIFTQPLSAGGANHAQIRGSSQQAVSSAVALSANLPSLERKQLILSHTCCTIPRQEFLRMYFELFAHSKKL